MAKPIDILKALSDHGRLRILKVLEYKSLCVCEITELIGLATPTISSHLKVLKKVGLIEDEKDGKWINYRMVHKLDFFFTELWRIVSRELDQDPLVEEDRRRMSYVDRFKICGVTKKNPW
jgi:ArsR family transcriptional regulator, arsenate/arsenite/antimonite-responsive transcriptional repressor